MFAMETGWPPPGVIGHGDHAEWNVFRAFCEDRLFQFRRIHVAFKRLV